MSDWDSGSVSNLIPRVSSIQVPSSTVSDETRVVRSNEIGQENNITRQLHPDLIIQVLSKLTMSELFRLNKECKASSTLASYVRTACLREKVLAFTTGYTVPRVALTCHINHVPNVRNTIFWWTNMDVFTSSKTIRQSVAIEYLKCFPGLEAIIISGVSLRGMAVHKFMWLRRIHHVVVHECPIPSSLKLNTLFGDAIVSGGHLHYLRRDWTKGVSFEICSHPGTSFDYKVSIAWYPQINFRSMMDTIECNPSTEPLALDGVINDVYSQPRMANTIASNVFKSLLTTRAAALASLVLPAPH